MNEGRLIKLQDEVLRIWMLPGSSGIFSNIPLWYKILPMESKSSLLFWAFENIWKNKLCINDNGFYAYLYSFCRQKLKLPKTRANYGRQPIKHQILFVWNTVEMQVNFGKQISNHTFKAQLGSNIQCFKFRSGLVVT